MGLHRALAAAACAALVLAACGDDDDGGGGGSAQPADDVLSIHAGEALDEVVDDLVEGYRAESGADTEIEVVLHADTEGLLAAIESDEPPELIVAADLWLESVAGEIDARPFGRTLGVIATPPGNPGGVTDLEAFAQGTTANVRVCGPHTSFGNISALLLTNAGLTPDPALVGADCEAEALDQAAAGEIDGVLLFRPELGTRSDVEVVEIPEDRNVAFDISYAVIDDRLGAGDLAAFIDSQAGVDIRTEAGWLP